MTNFVTTNNTRTGQAGGRAYLFFVCLSAAMGGFCFGYDGGAFGGAQIFIRQYFLLAPGQFGLIIAASALGCLPAPLLGAPICDRFGSKRVMVLSAALLLAGTLGSASATTMPALLGFRIFTGLGVGLISLASPLFIAEIASSDRRGRLGFLYQVGIITGSLLGVVAAWLVARSLTGDTAWRLIVLTSAAPSLLFLALALRLPASPRWLARHGHQDQALAILCRINGSKVAQAVLEEIGAPAARAVAWKELFGPVLRPILLVGLLLALLNNWTGWSAVASYLPTIFQMGGYPDPGKAVGVTIIPTALAMVFTLAAVALIDRIGRRPLWIFTSAAMALFLMLLGLVFHLRMSGPVVLGVTLLVSLPHAMGLGPIPWLMISEIFPTPARARAMSLCTSVLWLGSFFAVSMVPKAMSLSQRLLGSPAGVYWAFAAVCVLSVIFGWRLLPETRGRTLEEIAANYTDPGIAGVPRLP